MLHTIFWIFLSTVPPEYRLDEQHLCIDPGTCKYNWIDDLAFFWCFSEDPLTNLAQL